MRISPQWHSSKLILTILAILLWTTAKLSANPANQFFVHPKRCGKSKIPRESRSWDHSNCISRFIEAPLVKWVHFLQGLKIGEEGGGLIGPGLRITLLAMVKTPSGGGPPSLLCFSFFAKREGEASSASPRCCGWKGFSVSARNWFGEQGCHDWPRSDTWWCILWIKSWENESSMWQFSIQLKGLVWRLKYEKELYRILYCLLDNILGGFFLWNKNL